jgi:hypothetical protein
MTRAEEAKLRDSLTEILEEWYIGEASDLLPESGPILGQNTYALMAEAALSVLHGIADAQAEGLAEGYFQRGENF